MRNGATEEEMERMKAMGVKFFDSPEEAELDYLQEGLKRTPEERFRFLMTLMKIEGDDEEGQAGSQKIGYGYLRRSLFGFVAALQ